MHDAAFIDVDLRGSTEAAGKCMQTDHESRKHYVASKRACHCSVKKGLSPISPIFPDRDFFENWIRSLEKVP